MDNYFANHQLIEGDFNPDDIYVMEEIGRGNSSVLSVKVHGHVYAMKEIQIKYDFQYRNFLKEISLMQELSQTSSCVIRYEGYFITQNTKNHYSRSKYAFLLMEYAKMNLQHYISHQFQANLRVSSYNIEKIISYLLKSFAELESKDIAHCDIKPENILLKDIDSLELRICDVGSCKILNSQTIEEATIYGTVPWMAPELIKAKTKKVLTHNVYKCDVFSFGLLCLFVIHGKKFTTRERVQFSNDHVYQEIIGEWIKEAVELVNHDSKIKEVLYSALKFDEYKRPLFKELKFIYDSFRRKNKIREEVKIRKLSSEQENSHKNMSTFEQTSNYQTTIQNLGERMKPSLNTMTRIKKIKLSRLNTKMSTSSILKSQKSQKNRLNKISPNTSMKSNTSNLSSSPEKGLLSPLYNIKKIIHITDINKESIPYDFFTHEEKIFVLHTDSVNFKKADVVTILPTCPLNVLYRLSEVTGNSLHFEYKGYHGKGICQDTPILDFKKVYINIEQTGMTRGYNELLRSLCPISVQKFDLRATGSQLQKRDIIFLLERLKNRNIQDLSLSWERNYLQSHEHTEIMQRIGKLALRKLTLILNQSYIRYEKRVPWELPLNCEILYLQYKQNYMGTNMESLSSTLKKMQKLKWFYLNLENNNLQQSDINILVKSLMSLLGLEKLVLNLSWNLLEDVDYLSQVISKGSKLKTLQLRLHKCGIAPEKFYKCVYVLREVLEKSEQIIKLTYDRKIEREEFTHQLQNYLEGKAEVQVIGYDQHLYSIFLRKKAKVTTHRVRTMNSTKELERGKAPNKVEGGKTEKEEKKAKECPNHYCNYQSYESFICLSCCEQRQLAKSQFYCKFCIHQCQHRCHKNHHIVKVFERRTCLCGFGGGCTGEGCALICGQYMGIKYKRQNRCYKCMKSLCDYCARWCKNKHPEWVEALGRVFFDCQSKLSK